MAAPPGGPRFELEQTGSYTPEAWEPPSSRSPRRRRWKWGLGVGVAIIVILLVISGEFPGIPGLFPSNHSTNGLSFATARSIADSMAEKLFGSSQLIFATGVANNRTYATALQNVTGSSCPLSGGNTARFVLPAAEGNLTLGLAPAWVFQYVLGPNSTFYVGVVNGSAVYYGEFVRAPTQNCIGIFSTPYPDLPSGLIDSPQAASSAAPEATNFLRDNSIHLVFYSISEQSLLNTEVFYPWALYYETCDFGTVGAGLGLFVGINGVTGSDQGPFTGSVSGTVVCSPSYFSLHLSFP